MFINRSLVTVYIHYHRKCVVGVCPCSYLHQVRGDTLKSAFWPINGMQI